MSALATLRHEGFVLRLVDGECIGIVPIERVDDERRAWFETGGRSPSIGHSGGSAPRDVIMS